LDCCDVPSNECAHAEPFYGLTVRGCAELDPKRLIVHETRDRFGDLVRIVR